MNARNMVLCVAVVALVLWGATACGRPVLPDPAPEILPAEEVPEGLEAFRENIMSGGPPPDGIPPIETPQYQPLDAVGDRLHDDDVVFVVEATEGVFVYPQTILVWHEIVNETFDGVLSSLTYCPLTGSAIGYRGRIGDVETTFGTSGKLVNSNLVMYDRDTDSYWPQVLGRAVEGDYTGRKLETFPVIWTRWHRVKAHYGEASVLTEGTGFLRDYTRDPYGSYRESGNYYDSGPAMFPVMAEDDRFEPKTVVIGGWVNDQPFAIPKETLQQDPVLAFSFEDHALLAVYDMPLDTVRVFLLPGGEGGGDWNVDEERFRDRTSGNSWTLRGEQIDSPSGGNGLPMVESFDVMWFAWFAFHPETTVHG